VLDPLLHPLIEEIKDLFIDGNFLQLYECSWMHDYHLVHINVYYSAEIAGIQPGDAY